MAAQRFIGRPVKRIEDLPLLTGRGVFIADLPFANLRHAAILRAPYAHARILGINASRARGAPGVVGVITGNDVARLTRPFAVGVRAPVKYYCMATGKVRFVGEPVAVVVADDRYLAEDALELIEVEYEPLPAVIDPERAAAPDAPVLHEEAGTNVACRRKMTYGDPQRCFEDADVVVKAQFKFPKYSSTPIETYGVAASYEPGSGVLTIWANFMGPFILHSLLARSLNLAENRLRLIVPPDIGGSYGIKTSIFPYMALLGLAAMETGVTVRWIEDRREHLLAASSGTDRVAYRELAARKDGTLLAMRARWLDNVGGYIRSPEPGCAFRPIGNWVGPYRVQSLDIDAGVVMTNKCPTGPNRGYGCGHLYFEIERMVDMLADKLGMDPAEVRRRNLIQPSQFPYRTPTGGLYDSGDYPAAFERALKTADYAGLRREQVQARAQGRLFGVGLALAVDPSVSNMGYISVALDPEIRGRPGYLPKSGATEAITIRIDPLGKISVILGSTPQGQGHRTILAQVVADEFGVELDDVTVTDEMDTFTRLWSVSSGSYSSRFATVGASAAAVAARKLKAKLVKHASYLTEIPEQALEFADGQVRPRAGGQPALSLKELAGRVHWNAAALPEGIEPGLEATAVFGFPEAKSPDALDRVNSSNTYGFIAEVMAVEVDPETAAVKILRYVSVHDAGTIINPLIADGQILGGALHGLGGALYEELVYDEDGQQLCASFMDYLVPTAAEAPQLQIEHLASPSPFTPLGAKGLGEASSMTAPAVVANAVSDALRPLGIEITELPITPSRLWHLIEKARMRKP
jgi:2-furoyl-CoA dehydrogenase large subunit